MACMVDISVCCRCFTALMNPCAASTFCLRKSKASRDSRLWFARLRVCSSSSSVNVRLSRSSGTLRLFRLSERVPSSSVSTVKSGTICCRFFPMASPSELPGRGLSFVSSATACWYSSSVMPSFCRILSLFLRVKSSQHLPMMSSSVCFSGESSLRPICSSRHSCRLRAPMPAGSNSWMTDSTRSSSSGVVLMP